MERRAPLPAVLQGRVLLIGGCALLLLLGVVGIIGGISLLRRSGLAGGVLGSLARTATLAPEISTVEALLPSALPGEIAPLATQAQSLLPVTGETPSAAPSQTAGAVVPEGRLFVRINAIRVQNGRYAVDYETFGFTEALNQTHVHFFYNTVPPEQAGVPGKGPWALYGGPRPFLGFAVAGRPAEATQICALVANVDHSVQPDSGTCLDLP